MFKNNEILNISNGHYKVDIARNYIRYASVINYGYNILMLSELNIIFNNNILDNIYYKNNPFNVDNPINNSLKDGIELFVDIKNNNSENESYISLFKLDNYLYIELDNKYMKYYLKFLIVNNNIKLLDKFITTDIKRYENLRYHNLLVNCVEIDNINSELSRLQDQSGITQEEIARYKFFNFGIGSLYTYLSPKNFVTVNKLNVPIEPINLFVKLASGRDIADRFIAGISGNYVIDIRPVDTLELDTKVILNNLSEIYKVIDNSYIYYEEIIADVNFGNERYKKLLHIYFDKNITIDGIQINKDIEFIDGQPVPIGKVFELQNKIVPIIFKNKEKEDYRIISCESFFLSLNIDLSNSFQNNQEILSRINDINSTTELIQNYLYNTSILNTYESNSNNIGATLIRFGEYRSNLTLPENDYLTNIKSIQISVEPSLHHYSDIDFYRLNNNILLQIDNSGTLIRNDIDITYETFDTRTHINITPKNSSYFNLIQTDLEIENTNYNNYLVIYNRVTRLEFLSVIDVCDNNILFRSEINNITSSAAYTELNTTNNNIINNIIFKNSINQTFYKSINNLTYKFGVDDLINVANINSNNFKNFNEIKNINSIDQSNYNTLLEIDKRYRLLRNLDLVNNTNNVNINKKNLVNKLDLNNAISNNYNEINHFANNILGIENIELDKIQDTIKFSDKVII